MLKAIRCRRRWSSPGQPRAGCTSRHHPPGHPQPPALTQALRVSMRHFMRSHAGMHACMHAARSSSQDDTLCLAEAVVRLIHASIAKKGRPLAALESTRAHVMEWVGLLLKRSMSAHHINNGPLKNDKGRLRGRLLIQKAMPASLRKKGGGNPVGQRRKHYNHGHEAVPLLLLLQLPAMSCRYGVQGLGSIRPRWVSSTGHCCPQAPCPTGAIPAGAPRPPQGSSRTSSSEGRAGHGRPALHPSAGRRAAAGRQPQSTSPERERHRNRPETHACVLRPSPGGWVLAAASRAPPWPPWPPAPPPWPLAPGRPRPPP